MNSGPNPNEAYDPSRLLDALIFHLRLKNDSALARLLGVRPQRVSKIRRRANPVSAALLIRMSEITSFNISELRQLLGDRRSKYRIGPNHFKPKEGGGYYLGGESADGEGANSSSKI